MLGLIIEGNRAVGVRYVLDGKAHTARVEQEVLLSAGSLMSPAVLMHSGIGPADDLRRLGITVAADLPGVGQNLHDHLVCPFVWESPREVSMGGTSGMNAHIFHKSRPDLVAPDTQSLLFTMAVPVEGYEPVKQGFTLYAGLDRPYSRGSVRLASADPMQPPSSTRGSIRTRVTWTSW